MSLKKPFLWSNLSIRRCREKDQLLATESKHRHYIRRRKRNLVLYNPGLCLLQQCLWFCLYRQYRSSQRFREKTRKLMIDCFSWGEAHLGSPECNMPQHIMEEPHTSTWYTSCSLFEEDWSKPTRLTDLRPRCDSMFITSDGLPPQTLWILLHKAHYH